MVTARAVTDGLGNQGYLSDLGKPISNKEVFSERITRLSRKKTKRAFSATLAQIVNAKEAYANSLLIGVDWLHNRLGYPMDAKILVEQKGYLFILTADSHIVRAISNNIQVEKRKATDAENGRI